MGWRSICCTSDGRRTDVNKAHLVFCSSAEWAEACKKWIVPGALDGVELGDHLLEVGPGPGRTTEIIREIAPRMTAVEIDTDLARQLEARLGGVGSNVGVVQGDGTKLPFPDATFSAAVSFTMLHHVPSPELQDRLLAEVARVLRPGAMFTGVDSRDSDDFRKLHVDDICVPLIPDEMAGRLERAGFRDVRVDPNPYVVQFRAVR
jgi:ubiquinone/menaquinone biosynthesis C-methylase UbiE